jgi:thiamine biosynthesis lipoprotein
MTVQLQRRGMAINLGGIGKGHGVDRAGEVLQSRGVENFIIGGGGDLLVRGSKGGTPWRLGIQHPRRRGQLMGYLSLESNGAVVTSGDYERFVEIDGRRYHHIVDPRTGRPARGCVGVTLTAPNATQADAMATAVFVMGPIDGMELVEQTDGVEAVIIDDQLRMTISPGLRDVVHLRE